MLTLPLFTIFTIATTYCLLVYGPFMNHHFRSYPAVIKCGWLDSPLYTWSFRSLGETSMGISHQVWWLPDIVPLVTRCITIISYTYICSWLSHVYPHQIPIVDGYVPMFHFLWWFGSPKEWVTGSTAWAMARDRRKGAAPSSRSGARTKSNRMLESWVGCTLVRTQ